MAKKTGKSQIDVKTLLKKLKKRRALDTKALPRDRKLLEHLVFALLLEDYSLANARSAFAELQRYFIDWNEIRVARAYEIVEVITDSPDSKATIVSERLRRILQWIFDEKYKFDLEEYRAKGSGALLEFLESIPYCTRFMREYVAVFAFGENGVPLDENSLRALRLLGAVSVVDGKEVATCLKILKDSDATDFFFALHELGVELADPKTRGAARKFLRAFDSEIDNRSESPLVESAVPTDPRDIAKMCMKNRRAQRPTMPPVDDVDEFGDVDDDKGEEDDIERMISASQNDGTQTEEAPAERSVKRGRKSNASSSAAVEIGVSRDGMTYVKNETAETTTPSVKKTRAAQKSPVEEKSVKSAAPDETKRVKAKKKVAEEAPKTLSLLEEPEVAPSKPAKSASKSTRTAKDADAKAAKKEAKADVSVKASKSKKTASAEKKAAAEEAASVRPAKRRVKLVEPEPTPKKATKAVAAKSAKADAPKAAVKKDSRAKVKEASEAAKKVKKSVKEAVKETKKDAKSAKAADAAPKSKVSRALKKIAETVVPGKTSKKSRKEADSSPKTEKGKSVTKTRKPSSEPPDSSSNADVGKKAGKRSSKRK
ncbi:MAG: hypothetical protein II561_05260 [Thermoguttaceae bacterium]|nr:hypothetical protein [Thermoguttaceae bacterium]